MAENNLGRRYSASSALGEILNAKVFNCLPRSVNPSLSFREFHLSSEVYLAKLELGR